MIKDIDMVNVDVLFCVVSYLRGTLRAPLSRNIATTSYYCPSSLFIISL